MAIPKQPKFLLWREQLVQRVERLAQEHRRESRGFHQTRPPFTRLRDVLGPIHAQRAPTHPSHCQSPNCGQDLGDRFYRRVDGYVVCTECFGQLGPEE